jgi:hypothetical protein
VKIFNENQWRVRAASDLAPAVWNTLSDFALRNADRAKVFRITIAAAFPEFPSVGSRRACPGNLRRLSMADLHTAIVERLTAHRDLTYFRFAHREQRSPIAAARLKRRMGVAAGIPDLVFVLPDGRAAFLQVKPRTGKSLSPEQIAFRDRCKTVGAPYAIARTVEEAERVLASWRGLRVSCAAGAVS